MFNNLTVAIKPTQQGTGPPFGLIHHATHLRNTARDSAPSQRSS